MENMRQVSSVCRKHAIPLYFDDFDSLPASPRTLIFIKLREAGDESETPSRLRGRCSAMAGDGCTLSAKKDVLANIGGFLCTNNDALAQQREEPADFSPKGTQPIAVWQGAIWKLWTSATRKLWKKITSDIAWARLRSWEITSLSAVSQLFSSAAGMPSTLMRMLFAARSSGAVPGRSPPSCILFRRRHPFRRDRNAEVRTSRQDRPGAARHPAPRLHLEHIDYGVEVILDVWKRGEQLRGFRLSHEAPFRRHFTARFEPLPQRVPAGV